MDDKRYKDIHKPQKGTQNSRNSKNPKSKARNKLYCKLLTKVIIEAKILQYKKQISTSYNKTRTIWNIVKSETEKKRGTEEIS